MDFKNTLSIWTSNIGVAHFKFQEKLFGEKPCVCVGEHNRERNCVFGGEKERRTKYTEVFWEKLVCANNKIHIPRGGGNIWEDTALVWEQHYSYVW